MVAIRMSDEVFFYYYYYCCCSCYCSLSVYQGHWVQSVYRSDRSDEISLSAAAADDVSASGSGETRPARTGCANFLSFGIFIYLFIIFFPLVICPFIPPTKIIRSVRRERTTLHLHTCFVDRSTINQTRRDFFVFASSLKDVRVICTRVACSVTPLNRIRNGR